MRKIKGNFWAQIIIIYTRFSLGGAFVFASIIKIKGKRFTSVSGEDAPFGTAFHFFETMYQSGVYWQFLGWGQLIAGMLLMTQRYAKLGAVINFPIVLNIFVITISMDFNYTPVITGMMLLANLVLLGWHWDELKILLNIQPTAPSPIRLKSSGIWEITGILLFALTVGYRAMNDLYDPILWMGTMILMGLVPMVLVLINRKKYRDRPDLF